MSEARSYHHGDLRHAMIAAAEAVLAERGVAGFTLRECARRAGVSSGAPAHHFGNVAGLLTAIATIGFDGLTEAMAAVAADGTPAGGLRAIGEGYIRYALANPDRFRVMFGRVTLHSGEPAHMAAGARAYGVLIARVAALVPPDGVQDAAHYVWSAVHGFATLALDGRLELDLADAAAVAQAARRLLDRVVAAFDRGDHTPRGW